MKRVCKQCGKEFVLTQSEIQFYKKKKLQFPKRCKECRELNKAQKKSKGEKQEQAKQREEAQKRPTQPKKAESVASYPAGGSKEPDIGTTAAPNEKKGNLLRYVIIAVVVLAAVIWKLFLGGSPAGNEASQAPASQTEVQSDAETEQTDEEAEAQSDTETETESEEVAYQFRSEKLLTQHYLKHGQDMGFQSAEEYEARASAVVNDPDALHKTEAEDGDDVYYLEATNEFVIVSTDGYLRTYFLPDAGIDYYNRQ